MVGLISFFDSYSFFLAKEEKPSKVYNPFLDDLNLFAAFTGKSRVSMRLKEQFASILMSAIGDMNYHTHPVFSQLFLALGELRIPKAIDALVKYHNLRPVNLHITDNPERPVINQRMIIYPILYAMTHPDVPSVNIDGYTEAILFDMNCPRLTQLNTRSNHLIAKSHYPNIPFYWFPDVPIDSLSSQKAYQKLHSNLQSQSINEGIDNYFTNRALHYSLKPQGYNPTVKRLSS